MNIDFFCQIVRRLQLALLIPSVFFSFSLSLALPSSFPSCGGSSGDVRVNRYFFSAGICQEKYDVMESFIYVGVKMYVYGN